MSAEGKAKLLAYCMECQTWETDKEWANYGFTNEMSIEIGAVFGECLVWREEDERWTDDGVGAKKMNGNTVMCWGMMSYNYKGPFFVWVPETKAEHAITEAEIAHLNTMFEVEEKELNKNWFGSPEWQVVKEKELAAARVQ